MGQHERVPIPIGFTPHEEHFGEILPSLEPELYQTAAKHRGRLRGLTTGSVLAWGWRWRSEVAPVATGVFWEPACPSPFLPESPSCPRSAVGTRNTSVPAPSWHLPEPTKPDGNGTVRVWDGAWGHKP